MQNLLKTLLLILITFSTNAMAADQPKYSEAVFGMGCFWCGSAAFTDKDTNDNLPGIISVHTGYTGGEKTDPSYTDHEGHKEAVRVTYDPNIISYDKLLDIFWHNIDPLDGEGQFCDRGSAFISVIYYQDSDQQLAAEESKKQGEQKLGKTFATKILPAKTFYKAEEEHQSYKAKNPTRYKYYYWRCGRAERLNEVWNSKN